jgi:hypothetical protein
MQKFRIFLCAAILSSLIMGGCASAPNYGDAFSPTETVKGNAESMPGSADIVWASALEVVVQQGFNIERADAQGRIMHVTKEIRNRDDKEFSHTVKSTITMVPLSDKLTRVMLSANQTTELHKKSYVWWHLLWMIPIFPTGTEYTTVVTERDTVRAPEFYKSFFSELAKSLAEKQKITPKKVDIIPLPPAQSALPPSALTLMPASK